RFSRDWSSDVCSSDLQPLDPQGLYALGCRERYRPPHGGVPERLADRGLDRKAPLGEVGLGRADQGPGRDFARRFVAHLGRATESEVVTVGSGFDDDGVLQALPQALDARLEMGLVFLGDVVFGVLLEVTEFPG